MIIKSPKCEVTQEAKLPSAIGIDYEEEFNTFTKNFSLLSKPLANLNQSITSEKNKSQNPLFPQLTDFSLIPPLPYSSLPVIPKLISSYQFELEIENGLSIPIHKSQYFNFKVILGPLTDLQLARTETLDLKVVILSQDDQKINKNMKGGKILKGNYKQTMKYFTKENKHIAYFRIQITEVSCHYIGKVFNLEIRSFKRKRISETTWKVKSFLMKNLKVKAKDYRKKA